MSLGNRFGARVVLVGVMGLGGYVGCGETEEPSSIPVGAAGEGAGGGAAGSAPLDPCAADDEEACCALEHTPCEGLSQTECARVPYCDPVMGHRFTSVDELEGSGGFWGGNPLWDEYIGCRVGFCGAGDAISCTFNPAKPSECYVIPTTEGPDGWDDVFECGMADEQCGASSLQGPCENGDQGACCALERTPCRGLSEQDCQELPFCEPALGHRYTPADFDGQGGFWGGEMPGEREYLGCRAACGAFEGSTCVFDPAKPNECYFVVSVTIPEGWEELVDCENAAEQCQ